MHTKPALTSQTKDLPTSPVDSQQEDRGQPLEVKKDLPYGQMLKWGEVVNKQEWSSEWVEWPPEWVDKTSKEKGLIAIFGYGQYFFPDWQFQPNGSMLPGLEEVRKVLKQHNHNDLSQIIFMTTGDMRLSGKTPLDCLRSGRIEEVLQSADCYGRQITS